jgi:hypothetical protein
MIMNGRVCFKGFTTTRSVCKDWRDDGYSTCARWGDDCVSWAEQCVVRWIPIIGPLICLAFRWVCRAFQALCKLTVWITHWVCHAWNIVKTFICLLWMTVVFVQSAGDRYRKFSQDK